MRYCTGMVTKIRGKSGGRKYHLYIAEHMKAKDLSDERVALRMGVSRVTVTRYRNQQWRLRPEKIANLAEAIGLNSPDELSRPPGAPASPDRPSIDALLKDEPAETVQKLAELLPALLKRGTR